LGLVVSLIAAGGTGLYFGKRSHVTLEEIRAEQETVTGGAQGGGGDTDMSFLSGEVNRTLLELWKMEDIEYMRNSR
jgi:hypothetical protein